MPNLFTFETSIVLDTVITVVPGTSVVPLAMEDCDEKLPTASYAST